jgi:tetratricopeptide (TPR) repeat protein
MNARPVVPLLVCSLLLACTPADERAAGAREEAAEALGRGDRAAALAALREIPAQAESAEGLLDHARLLASAGEAAQSVWLLEAGVRRHPDRADLRLALAQLHLVVDNPSAAREAAHAIPAGSEEHAAALLAAAQADLALGSLERALEVLEQAERLYPERLEARLVRVSVLATERRVAEARALLDETRRAQADQEMPEHLRAAMRRLDVGLYSAQVVSDEAEEAETEAARAGLRALVEEDPGDPLAWQALLQALARQRRSQEGLDLLLEAIAEDPDRLALYPIAARLHAGLGDADAGTALLRQLLERSPTASSYVVLAQHVGRRDPDPALSVYAEGVAALPDEAFLARAYAEALLDAARLDEAREAVARFEELAPRDLHAEYLGARLDLASGDAPRAQARLEKLVAELDQHYTQYWLARSLEDQGDRAGAQRRYALALLRNPADPAPYGPLIRLAQQRGDWRETVATAQLLVRRFPGMTEGWLALASALTNLGDGQALERVVSAYVALQPESGEAALFVARAQRLQGRHAAALDELAEIETRLGTSPELEAERALTLGLAGRVPEGIEVARLALEAHPDAAILHGTLASLLFSTGQAAEGSAEVDRALASNPANPHPLRVRAEFRAASGRLAESRDDCLRYLEARPDDAGVHFILGAVEQALGRREAAIAAYRRAAELDPKAQSPRNNLAVLLAGTDLPGALKAAQEAYALAPGDPDVLDTLGWLYLQAGRPDRSVSLLEDAHRAAPGNAETRLHLALAYRDAGRADDARPHLTALSGDGPAGIRSQAEEALRSLQ